LARLQDCRLELHSILQEERLFGATLLVLANKQDLPSALKLDELNQVRTWFGPSNMLGASCSCLPISICG